MDEIKINDAIVRMKEKEVFLTIYNNTKSIVGYNNNLFYIKSNNANIILDINQFSELFKNNIFLPYSLETFDVDSEKDKEYYSFKHK